MVARQMQTYDDHKLISSYNVHFWDEITNCLAAED